MTDEELGDALSGLYAYDTGCTDSGIHDERLRQQCIEEMRSRTGPAEIAPRLLLSRMIRDHYLTEEALARGYGIEDVMSFASWLDEHMEITF
jgi:hypothetical protein